MRKPSGSGGEPRHPLDAGRAVLLAAIGGRPGRARDVMGAPVVTVAPRTAVERAVTLLSAHGFTALPVVDDDHLIGIVTRGDLVRAVSRQTVGDAARRLGEHGAEAHRG